MTTQNSLEHLLLSWFFRLISFLFSTYKTKCKDVAKSLFEGMYSGLYAQVVQYRHHSSLEFLDWSLQSWKHLVPVHREKTCSLLHRKRQKMALGQWNKLRYLVLGPININSSSMGQNHIVSCNKRLLFRIASFTASKWHRAARWRVNPWPISLGYHNIWFIESCPVFHSITKVLEANVCIMPEIFPGKCSRTY